MLFCFGNQVTSCRVRIIKAERAWSALTIDVQIDDGERACLQKFYTFKNALLSTYISALTVLLLIQNENTLAKAHFCVVGLTINPLNSMHT